MCQLLQLLLTTVSHVHQALSSSASHEGPGTSKLAAGKRRPVHPRSSSVRLQQPAGRGGKQRRARVDDQHALVAQDAGVVHHRGRGVLRVPPPVGLHILDPALPLPLSVQHLAARHSRPGLEACMLLPLRGKRDPCALHRPGVGPQCIAPDQLVQGCAVLVDLLQDHPDSLILQGLPAQWAPRRQQVLRLAAPGWTLRLCSLPGGAQAGAQSWQGRTLYCGRV